MNKALSCIVFGSLAVYFFRLFVKYYKSDLIYFYPMIGSLIAGILFSVMFLIILIVK